MVLSMSKVVFEMVALGFKDIMVFIFSFPATSARTDDGGNRFWVEEMVSDKLEFGLILKRKAVNESHQLP